MTNTLDFWQERNAYAIEIEEIERFERAVANYYKTQGGLGEVRSAIRNLKAGHDLTVIDRVLKKAVMCQCYELVSCLLDCGAQFYDLCDRCKSDVGGAYDEV